MGPLPTGSRVLWWLAPSPHSNNVLGTNPPGWGLSVWSIFSAWVLWLPRTVQRHEDSVVRLIGESLVGYLSLCNNSMTDPQLIS